MLSSALPLLGLLLQAPAAPEPSQVPSYVPHRVYDTASRTFVDFETMLVAISRVDVVFVGEQHDDPATHRLEAAILDGLHRRKVAPILSLEMFERDGQSGLDAYLAGRLTEDDMLKVSRPWPRYRQDYRAMVEMAKQRGFSVIAMNVPRRIASAVARSGHEAVAALPETDRPFVARDLQCPLDSYFDRFVQTMTGHPAGAQTPEQQRATTERYYWAQCVKDETMAESIASAFERRAVGQGPVVHYTGAFHSDFGLGTAERVRRRLPGRRSIVVSMLPVGDLDAVAPAGDELNRAHYLVYTVK